MILCLYAMLAWIPGDEITVTFGRPNVWSLEQAHYLLANLRKKNSSLTVQAPGSLDPNEINVYRDELLATIFSADVEYDQIALQKFRQDSQIYNQELVRKNQLNQQIDALRPEVIKSNADVAAQQVVVDSFKTEGAPPDETNKMYPYYQKEVVKLAELQSRNTLLTDQLGDLTTERNELAKTTPTYSPNQTSTNVAAAALPDTKLTARPDKTPKLSASTKLDNYLNMQYELLAKQLTLLRDEVGPEERLLFLELPQSMKVKEKKAKGHVVEVAWTITREWRTPHTKILEMAIKEMLKTQRPIQNWNLSDEQINNFVGPSVELLMDPFFMVGINGAKVISPNDFLPYQFGQILDAFSNKHFAYENNFDALYKALNYEVKGLDRTLLCLTVEILSSKKESLVNTLRHPSFYAEAVRKIYFQEDNAFYVTNDRLLRAIDIIPRQSMINVNQSYQRSSTLNIGLLGKLLGGGLSTSYQRRKELIQQTINQEYFASGFGKGSNVFGWTFAAKPGDQTVAPGVKTTYAVIVVPSDVSTIELIPEYESYKPRKGPKKTTQGFPIRMTLPNIDPGFWVDEVGYTQAEPGEIVTVRIEGFNFPPQLGVLVGGRPLKKVTSIAGYLTNENVDLGSSSGPRTGSRGVYEYNSSKQLTLAIHMPTTYKGGTPEIVLVTPSKTKKINHYDITVNNKAKSLDDSMPMFSRTASIETVEVVGTVKGNNDQTKCELVPQKNSENDFYQIFIDGANLYSEQQNTDVYLNGERISCIAGWKTMDPLYISGESNAIKNKKWNINVFMRDKDTDPDRGEIERGRQIVNHSIDNPLILQINGSKVIQLDPPTMGEIEYNAIVQVTGTGLNGGQFRKVEEKTWTGAYVSDPQSMFLKLESKTNPVNLIISDSKNFRKALITINIPAKPKIISVKTADGKDQAKEKTKTSLIIKGHSFQLVNKVKFDDKDVSILSVSSDGKQIMVQTDDKLTAGEYLVRALTPLKFNNQDVNSEDNVKFKFTKPPS